MDKLLLIDDEADVQYSFRRIFDSSEIQLTTASSGEEALKAVPKLKPDLVIMDIRMGVMDGLETLRRLRKLDGRLPVIMMTAYGTTQAAIEAMKLGAYDYLLKPFDVPRLKETVFEALKAARAMKQVVSYEPLLQSEDYDLGIVGRCQAMQNVFKLIGQLSASDATALITGESGTGKELVARAIYSHSRRADQPFVAINCAAIPENLLESELFGHEKGAFTGATHQRIGKFEQCNQGTLFLDEIGDMTLATQTKILRVIQSGSFERVGGNQTIQVDVRVIAATNQPLERAVATKQFREDLFYRLNVVRIALPPLRERPGDVRLLVNYFLKKFAEEQATTPHNISLDALNLLQAHTWPGNVRELENVIRRALVVAKGEVILPADLPPEVTTPRLPPGGQAAPALSPSSGGTQPAPGALGDTSVPSLARALFQHARLDARLRVLPAVERELIIQALIETRGNQVQASKLLGITRSTLRKRIAKFGIKQEFAAE
ncbi:MAG TPA: sigma-54 dependent transcriptional regulator [Verrucomicrobiae bacterium]|nr:sigma-54 dependent transcriptional regulator [Verrucomicrobiae bacterium]